MLPKSRYGSGLRNIIIGIVFIFAFTTGIKVGEWCLFLMYAILVFFWLVLLVMHRAGYRDLIHQSGYKARSLLIIVYVAAFGSISVWLIAISPLDFLFC